MGVELLKTFFDEGSGGLLNIPDSSEESVRIALVALSHLRQRRGEILPAGRLHVRRGNPGARGTVHVHEGLPYGKFDLCRMLLEVVRWADSGFSDGSRWHPG